MSARRGNAWRAVPALVVAAGCMLLAGAGWRAVRLDRLPEPRAGAAAPLAEVATGRPPYPVQRVMAAVDRDPFHAERRRPAERFRLPEDSAAAAPPQRMDLARVRLIGTGVLPDGGGFAVCQVAGASPLLVRVGGSLGDLVLRAVAPGRATFTTPAGDSLVVSVSQAGG